MKRRNASRNIERVTKRRTAGVFGAILCAAHLVPGNPAAAAPIRSDGSSVDAVVAALYASVTDGPGSEPDWERLGGIFLLTTIIVPPKGPREAICAAPLQRGA